MDLFDYLERPTALAVIIIGYALYWLFKFLNRRHARERAVRRALGPGDGHRLSQAARLDIEAALARGWDIEAIRIMRADTGMGLAEAKEAVEAMRGPAKTKDSPSTSSG